MSNEKLLKKIEMFYFIFLRDQQYVFLNLSFFSIGFTFSCDVDCSSASLSFCLLFVPPIKPF